MPSGLMPSYRYVPPISKLQPFIRSCSSTRARLFEGGTYFRVREPGGAGNNISVEIVEFSGPQTAEPDAICVVTNYNIDSEEMTTGPASSIILSSKLKYDEKIIFKDLTTTTYHAHSYRISAQIAPAPDIITDLGIFRFSQIFIYGSKLVAKVTPGASFFTPGDEITITPRFKLYRLATIIKPDTNSLPTRGWDIDNLRTQVNASNPWIEMLPRSGDSDDGMGGPPIPNPNPSDVQDDGVDDTFLSPFPEKFLSGGDGLPDVPNNEHTGPIRSLVHVNYGEQQNGSLTEANIVYEWAGESVSAGAWRAY